MNRIGRKCSGSWIAAAMIVMGMALLAPAIQAMPMFARQNGWECSTCHTVVPRLNRTGYDFRRAGFRAPEDIGTKQDFTEDRELPDFKMANYFSARLQMNASWLSRDNSTDTGGYDPNGGTFNKNSLDFKEFTLYPLTGGFLGNWAAESEISGTTDEIEVENAYIRHVWGDKDLAWEARVGIYHPFEGYGASDRPLGLSRSLIQTVGTINGNGDHNGWHPWGFDQSGLEGGVTIKNTSISVNLLNGLIENAADPAQGGGLSKIAGSPTQNDKDFQLFVNQFIGDSGAALSASYYDGRLSLGDLDTLDPTELNRNRFRRAIFYGNLPLGKVMLLGAYSWGEDKDDFSNVTSDNTGFFGEVDSYISEHLGVGARYGEFDSSDLIDNNDVKSTALFANYSGNNGLQVIGEYRHKETQKIIGPSQSDDSINIRLIYIW